MFTSKKQKLFSVDEKKQTSANGFINQGLKKSSETLSGNGALKYSSTGNSFIDQFGKIGSYRTQRKFEEIAADCELLYSKNKRFSIMFIFYLRMITRIVTLFNGISTKTTQKGAEMRHEGIMRMIWLHTRDQEIFWKNIGLFVSVGSWKDIITMLQYDLVFNGWEGRVLNWNRFGDLIKTGLENPNTNNLLKKYLPQIKAKSKCTTVESQADTMIGKWICSLLFGNKENSGTNYKRYRNLKSSGTAHEWQQLISQQKFERIDFSKIHGRALHLLVKGKFLKNQGLSDKYNAWITKPEVKEVKYTGFVHELFKEFPTMFNGWNAIGAGTLANIPLHKRETINKQFNTLLSKGGKASTNLIVVRDVSGSMKSAATGEKTSCFDIAKALALYFSYFLKGQFQNTYIEFSDTAIMHEWVGNTPIERWFNDNRAKVGSTDFQSVIKLFCDIKRLNPHIPESDYPGGILCISDSEFNPTSLGKTNVTAALDKLRNAGFSQEYTSNFVIVLWNLQSNHYGKGTGEKFETYGNTPNVFYFSGYSASIISFLTEGIKNAEELFDEVMNQEILQMIEV